MLPSGSAPRVRGTGRVSIRQATLPRFSPACAGNRQGINPTSDPATVQPRVCGEQFFTVKLSDRSVGSAPRVRGTVSKGERAWMASRFSPACAGNRPMGSRHHSERTVQPRVCGEQAACITPHFDVNGSAPRVRGTGEQKGPAITIPRFSPACAGNRWEKDYFTSSRPVQPRVCGEQVCGRWSRRTPRPVQPRVCGEQLVVLAAVVTERGSAPRVRGTGWIVPAHSALSRFSPACAGNRTHAASRFSPHPVQPRVCGEQDGSQLVVIPEGGSAPRVRGTGADRSCAGGLQRFSPACAGNSLDGCKGGDRQAVQPRVCGEQDLTGVSAVTVNGSAPRVRGTDDEAGHGGQCSRFSPACAGNSSPQNVSVYS